LILNVVQVATMLKVCVLLAANSVATASQGTPVQKVLDMLQGMVAKGAKQMEDERKIMQQYDEWVTAEERRLKQNIETSASDIEELIAFIMTTDSDAAQLADEIKELDGLIAEKEAEFTEAQDLRASQQEEFSKQQLDFEESVYALDRAIQTLQSQNVDRPQAMMMLQKMAKTKPALVKVLALVQEAAFTREPGAPAVAAYEFQSGEITDMLKNMLDKFKKQLGDLEKAEMNQAHNFDMESVHLKNLIKSSTATRQGNAGDRSHKVAESAKAKGDLAATKTAKAGDEKFLLEMTAVHEQKTGVFGQNQETRKTEIAALNKAIEIISSPDVADSYSNRINFVQKPSFLQIQSTSERVQTKTQVVDLLRKRARILSSKVLAVIAADVAANPFVKVIDMVKTLLAKLKEEAAAEADHKAWCDDELKSNKAKRKKKSTESAKLQAGIESLAVTIEKQGNSIEALAKEQSELAGAMAEATTERIAEKAENKAIISDAKAGSEAIKNALAVLREFYSKQGVGFIQNKQVPEMNSYGGMSRRSGGVVGMLEVIVSDFIRLEAETSSAETAAVQEYDQFIQSAKSNKKAKHKLEVKTKLDQDQTEFDQHQSEKMLRGVEEELSKANKYFEMLKPDCVQVQVSFNERTVSRKAEIEALKDAYAILDKKVTE